MTFLWASLQWSITCYHLLLLLEPSKGPQKLGHHPYLPLPRIPTWKHPRHDIVLWVYGGANPKSRHSRMDTNGYQWLPMVTNGYQWLPMVTVPRSQWGGPKCLLQRLPPVNTANTSCNSWHLGSTRGANPQSGHSSMDTTSYHWIPLVTTGYHL